MTVDNGVNVEALLGAREALSEAPAGAQHQWRASRKGVNGTHSESTGEGDIGPGERQEQKPARRIERLLECVETHGRKMEGHIYTTPDS